MRRILATLLLIGTAVLATATPALAHNVLVSSDPTEGAQLDVGPQQITLTFDQYVQAGDSNQLAVTGPDGGRWTDGAIDVKGSVVTAPVRPLGPAGQYTVGYRILSADGHPVSGEIRFSVATAGNGTPAPATEGQDGADSASGESGSDGGVPIWVWIAGAVVLLGVGLTVALRAGREGDDS